MRPDLRPVVGRVLAVLVLLLVAACGVPQDDAPRALQGRDLPLGLQSESAVPDPEGPGRVALYFVRDGQAVLWRRPVQASTPPTELLRMLFAGTSAEEREAGLISVIPASLTVESVEMQGDTAVVTLGGPDEELLNAGPLAFAQIVATLTPDRARGVRFRRDDRDLPVPFGDNQLSARPLDRSDYEGLLPGAPTPAPATRAPATPPPAAPAPAAPAPTARSGEASQAATTAPAA